MALTPAERARRYREKRKADVTAHEEFLRKDAKRHRESYTPVADKNDREKRCLRRTWRSNQKSSRSNRKAITKAVDAAGTPPPSPPPPTQSPSEHPVQPTPARACGRKKVRKDRAKAYTDINKLKGTVASQHRLMEKYKKRYFRLVSTSRKTRDSPSSKADRLLHGISRPEGCVEVRKVLIFHNALIMQLKKKYRLQQQIRRIAMGKVLRKYRMINRAKLAFAGGVDITPEEGVLDLDKRGLLMP